MVKIPVTLALADFDLPTRSASGFFLRYIVPRVEPVQLYAVLDRRLPFRLASPQSDVIIGAGHGDKTSFNGQNDSVLLEVGRYSSNEARGKVIKLLSCQTGVSLGPDLIRNGALAFMGYTDDYVWIMDEDLTSRPWSDELAARCLMPVIDSVNAILDGKTVLEAFNVERAGYLKNAQDEEDELIRSIIEFNMDNAVLLGDVDARIRPRPKITLPIPPPPLIFPRLTKPYFLRR